MSLGLTSLGLQSLGVIPDYGVSLTGDAAFDFEAFGDVSVAGSFVGSASFLFVASAVPSRAVPLSGSTSFAFDLSLFVTIWNPQANAAGIWTPQSP